MNYSFSNYNNNNKFGKTINDMFGVGKDMFSGYNSFGSGGYGGLISGALGGLSSALKGGSWKEDVPQSFFGIDDENDSEIMQAVKGAGKGASMGAAFGPWGAAIGGILGLGASFLDDI